MLGRGAVAAAARLIESRSTTSDVHGMAIATVLSSPDPQVWRLLGVPISSPADESTAPPASAEDGPEDSETLEVFLL